MRHRTVAALIAALVCALCALSTASASALELPEFETKTGFTGESAATTLETVGKTNIACKKSTIEGTASSKGAGTFNLSERECSTTLGVRCNSKGSEAGVILLSGEWDLATGEGASMLLVPREVEISCSSLTVKLKGTVLGMLDEVDTETKEHELELVELEGVQEVSEYENSKEETIQSGLSASINGGASEHAGLKAERLLLKTSVTTQIRDAPTFSVTNSLGNLPMPRRMPRTMYRIVNRTRAAAQPAEVRFTLTPVRAGNRPFLINEANRMACLNNAIRPGVANACSVELEYINFETGAQATLRVMDRNRFIVSSNIFGQ